MSPFPDVTAARAAIASFFPELAGLEVAPLGAGTDHRAFEVGGRLVFRFPRPEAADRLLVEARFSTWLAARLPLPLPRYRYLAPPSAAYTLPFGGYEKLPGTPGLERDGAPKVGAPLGDLLRALHGLDTAEAQRHGLRPDEDPALAAWSAEALEELRLLRERGLVEEGAAAAWGAYLAAPPAAEVAPQVIHGDFASEHVLLDESGRPTGVIDWSDAALGDPARDLAGLLHWGGESLLAAALEHYGPVDDTAVARARFYAACRAVADIAFGAQEERPLYVAIGRRALAELAPSCVGSGR